MTGTSATRSSMGVAVDGRDVSGARRKGGLRRFETSILGLAGLPSANRSVARALNGLIIALNVGTVRGKGVKWGIPVNTNSNRESWLTNPDHPVVAGQEGYRG